MEQSGWETDVGESVFRKQALVSEVVNREQRLDANERRVAGEDRMQIGGDQPGLPVVAMKHLWPEDAARHLERGSAEHRESNVVIGEISSGLAVHAFAIIELRAIEEIVGDLFADLIDAGQIGNPAQPDRKVIVDTASGLGREAAVARQ